MASPQVKRIIAIGPEIETSYSNSHVHLQEVSHGAGLLGLLYLECGEEVDEPLEALLVAVNPEKVHLENVN